MIESKFEQYVNNNFNKQFTFNKHITTEKITLDGFEYINVNYVTSFDIMYLGQILVTVNNLDKTGDFKSITPNHNVTPDCLTTQINLLNQLLPGRNFRLTKYGKNRLEQFYTTFEETGEYNY